MFRVRSSLTILYPCNPIRPLGRPPDWDAPNWPGAPGSQADGDTTSSIGNTVTLAGSDLLLNTVYLDLYGQATFTLDLYSGSNPNGETPFKSATVTTTIGSPNLLVPFYVNVWVPTNTVTFIISRTPNTGIGPNSFANLLGPLSGTNPTVGDATNAIWYESVNTSGFVSDSLWAPADGAPDNYLGAEFVTPEPDPGTLLACMLLGLGGLALLKEKSSHRV